MNVPIYQFKSKACGLYCSICLEISKIINNNVTLQLYKVRTKHSYSVMRTVKTAVLPKANLFSCTALKGAYDYFHLAHDGKGKKRLHTIYFLSIYVQTHIHIFIYFDCKGFHSKTHYSFNAKVLE